MDLTALAAALFVALGLIGADAVMSANNLIVEVVAPPRGDKLQIDEATLEQTFVNQLHAIGQARSLVDPPEIRTSKRQGIGMALAEAARVQGVAHALQTELGYDPDRLRLALFVQNGNLHALLTGSGSGRGRAAFEEVLTPLENETVPAFVRRTAVYGASQLAPYSTTLYLLQTHSRDKKFDDVLTLAEQAKAKLPPTPVNRQRSLYENVRGIVALFNNDAKAAKADFAKAVASDPSNPVAVLNLAFAEVELHDYAAAADRMERLMRDAPPQNNILQATAYMTWAAANIGLKDAIRADMMLAKALEIYPTSSTGYDLWAEVKELLGDQEAAAKMQHRALEETADAFENYAEVATLYFHLSWHDNVPVMRNRFAEAAMATSH